MSHVYLLATHIPIYVDGGAHYLEDSWFRDVLLARDWLAPPFGGELTLIAPSRPVTPDMGRLDAIDSVPGIRVVPAIDDRCRARHFWLTERKRWCRTVEHHVRHAAVLHTATSDLYRPMEQLAFGVARRVGVPTVLVGPDMDLHEVLGGRLEHGTLMERAWLHAYLAGSDRWYRSQLRHADLALLKEGAVFDRYARFAANPRAFCHSMYGADDVIGEEELARRLATLDEARPLRIVYCGRLVRRKGLHVSLEIVQRAHRAGAALEFDVIGSGVEEDALRHLVAERGLADVVRFVGELPYGRDLIRQLWTYDLVLFTPIEEDTPRMLFDGYAAGLPVLAADVPFVRHRATAREPVVTFPVGAADEGAAWLARLGRERDRLRGLSRDARLAGLAHSAESWYRKRRDWTIDAVGRRRGRAVAV